MCNLIDGLGGKPFIKPKSNSTPKAKGSISWKKIITLFLKYPAEFYKHYHQRSLVESAFAALKIRRGLGGSLRSRMAHTQDRELAIQVISYNIDKVARVDIESGRLTENMLKATVAH